MRKYYEAYDDRYRQVHAENLRWFADAPTTIVRHILEKYRISPNAGLLEVGCGEGRDARFLLEQGFNLLATDISGAAIDWCRQHHPQFAGNYRVLNCISERLERKFDFIYAVAVIHMLVEDPDRDGFYRFIRDQLSRGGIALICTMGDGETERQSDVSAAFDLQERIHEESGRMLQIAGTSYRAVSFDTFRGELIRNGLRILETGLTDGGTDYGRLMYAVVKNME